MQQRIIHAGFILWLLCNFVGGIDAKAQGSAPTFDINSGTLIVDTDGNYIDFQTFISLNPGTDYAELMPEFDEKGALKLIKINMIRKVDFAAQAEAKAKGAVTPVSSGSRAAAHPNNNQSAVITTPTPSPTGGNPAPVRTVARTIAPTPLPAPTQRSNAAFRFTTASELKGLQAPYYSHSDLSGKEYSSVTLAGKVVVVKFWFLGCGPCLEEIPQLNELVEKYKDNPNVVFIAPATDNHDAVRKFNAKRNFRYHILPDAFDIHGDFKVAGYPTHLVIYRNGMVGKVLTGKNSSLVNSLGKAIEEGLAMLPDDKSLVEIPQPLYKDELVIRAEKGARLNKKQYLEKLATGEYLIYKRTKMDGKEEIFLKNKNK